MDNAIDKIILGVDPGTVVMGYSVVHIIKGKVHPVLMDIIKLNTKLDHYTGLAGSYIAYTLGQKGYAVQVFEKRPDPRRSVYGSGRSINLVVSDRGWTCIPLLSRSF